MGSDNVQIVKSIKAPALPGKHHRIMCMTGQAKGTSYFIKGSRVILGRGDTADIKVMDIKSSREHAEITMFKKDYVITDLGSQNGIIVNDLKVTQHKLKDGDKIIIGQTVFKYSIIDVKHFLDDEEKDGEGDDDENDDDEENEEEPKKKKPVLLIAGVVVAALFLMGGEDEESPYKKGQRSSKAKDISGDLSNILRKKKQNEDKDVQKKLDSIIHRGQREFREGNYFRAIEEFNLALVLSPNNGRASFYLNKTKKALDDNIEEYFLKARREFDSLKYREAGVSYCTILRMLESYTDDPRYIRAEDQVKNVEKSLGLFEGEFKCFEE